jgi:hypothetical protein
VWFADTDTQAYAFKRFLDAIRADWRYKNSQFVTLIESDMSWIASTTFAKYFQPYAPYVHMSRDKDGLRRAGVPTKGHKLQFIIDTSLRLHYRKIRLEKDLLVPSGVAPVLAEFKRQARHYIVDERMPENPAFSDPKYGASGKQFGPDDLIMAMQILVYWSLEALEDPDINQTFRVYPYIWQP